VLLLKENDMKTLLATAALVLAGAVTVQAADIPPVSAHWTKLGDRFSALVYYIDEPDGFHVVVATEQGTGKKAALTFETVLAVGQSAEVSISRGAGEAWPQIVLSNAGDHLHIAEPPASVSAPTMTSHMTSRRSGDGQPAAEANE
jgi:hypothetical protein